jgi:hypothetical protein
MYRALPCPNPVIELANQQDAYRKHLSAVSNARSVIDTSAPPLNRRLAVWRKRLSHERRMRQALEIENQRKVRQSRPPLSNCEDFEDDFEPDDWIGDLPNVAAELSEKVAPPALLHKKLSPKVFQPKNGQKERRPSSRPAETVKSLSTSERIRFGGKGEIEVEEGEIEVEEGTFEDDWEDQSEEEVDL